MNAEAVAEKVSFLLGAYLKRRGEVSADESDERAATLYESVRRAFTGDAEAERALSRAAEGPEPEALSALKSVLRKRLEADPQLLKALGRPPSGAQARPRGAFIFGNRNVSIGGHVSGSQVTLRGPGTPAEPGESREEGVVRVFVSSTWLDLRPEREAVREALQLMRETRYTGMEYFGSREETTRDASLAEVDGSEVYVGVLAGRYGSGITEDEYRRAREKNLPCFIYFKRDAAVPAQSRETDPAQVSKLDALKRELRAAHTVTEFDTPEQLKARVVADLHRWLFDAYLRPRLDAAARRGRTGARGRGLVTRVRDFAALDADLLGRLAASGLVVIVGDGSVYVGGDVDDSRIINEES